MYQKSVAVPNTSVLYPSTRNETFLIRSGGISPESTKWKKNDESFELLR